MGVIKGIFIRQRRHDVANHVDIVAARRAPEHPFAPCATATTLANVDGLQLRVLPDGVLFERRDGVRYGDFRDVCLADSLLANREQAFGKADGGDGGATESFLTDSRHITCNIIHSDSGGDDNATRVVVRVFGAGLVAIIGKVSYSGVAAIKDVLDTINGHTRLG